MPCANSTLSDEVVGTIKTSPNTRQEQEQKQKQQKHHPQDNNNSQQCGESCCVASDSEERIQRCPARQTNEDVSATLKSSIYDWDSPSSFTGTVKRRRSHTIATTTSTTQRSKQTSAVVKFNNGGQHYKSTEQSIRDDTGINNNKNREVHRSTISVSDIEQNLRREKIKMASQQNRNKTEKPNKIRPPKSDRNANSTERLAIDSTPTVLDQSSSASAPSGAKPKDTRALQPKTDNIPLTNTPRKKSKFNVGSQGFSNYMELDFCDPTYPGPAQLREVFCDFPVSYATTNLVTPPPYRDPPPPTPPPLSQIPSRESRLLATAHDSSGISLSAPNTPSRGKVVLSKKERKELSKQLSKQHQISSEIVGLVAQQEVSLSAQSSPYKGRVTELKNCIAKINSRGLFSSLHRSSNKSLNIQDETPSSNEVSPPPPAPDFSPPEGAAATVSNNNDDGDYSEKLKNLPVRQRKAAISHLENYCLFDPVDFINEKALRYQNHKSATVMTSAQMHGLRDPLFSSRQHLAFDEEEMVPEVIYDDQDGEEETIIIETSEAPETEADAGASVHSPDKFDHHNYFVIDPDDFEEEPTIDIGIPNPYSNEQLINAKLAAVAAKQEHGVQISTSFEKLLSSLNTAPSMSNSQESKDTTTTNSTTETTSTALVESSTSTNSSTSQSSSAAQTTLQRTKKKLTFLNLSPFRTQKGGGNAKNARQNENKNVERALSELVSSDHMLHLQQMLQDTASKEKAMRCRTVPNESNYVLFNPGPVPSRNVQYKIRKPRPLSSHSDADSGFLSPCSPDELSSLKSNPTILVLQQCDSVQGYIEIYTDWANYYLERAKSKKKVTDLSADCRDGLLLADVIEAVTNFKVPDLVKKPKNQQQMYDNVNSCLNVLRTQSVGGLDNITTNDICAGRLKAVLALFFALSRFKQQAKQTKCIGTTGGCVSAGVGVEGENGNEMVNRQIPTAYSKANGGTAIPLPATVMVQRRCPPDKVRPLPPTPNHTPSIPGLGKSGTEFNTSRPNSPPTTNHTIQSLKSGNNNGLRPPTVKSSHLSGIPSPSATSAAATNANAPPQKHSMLDKLKLFNKEKQQQQQQQQQQNTANKTQLQSKRISSSSGFSSARSERSDSSLSLNDGHISQIKPPTVSLTSSKTQKNNTKQSKLLATQQKKEQSKANSKLDKLDKKEKSPARSLQKEESGMESRTSTMGRTAKNSLPRSVGEKNTPKTSSKSSLHSKSDSKTSLIMPATKNLNSPSGTGLPKPIAAIKGTSKLPQPGDNKLRLSNSNSQHDLLLKREKSDISSTNNATNTNISEQRPILSQPTSTASATQTHIVKPVPLLPEPGSALKPPPYYANTQNISQDAPGGYGSDPSSPQRNQEVTYGTRLQTSKGALGSSATPTRRLEYNAGPNVLMPQRSPMRCVLQNNQATQHNGMSPNSCASTASSPSSTAESHCITTNATSSPNKFHTIPLKIVGTIYETDEKPVSVLPMRPLLRGYNSHVTLPTRGTRGPQHYVADFCETDIGQGYCSDGDALRVSSSTASGSGGGGGTSSNRYHDIDNGYLSEGSSGIGLSSHGGAHSKHFLSVMRARIQLPTTIEERTRNSRGSLDSIGTAPPSSAASQSSSSGGSTSVTPNAKMDSSNHSPGPGSANGSPQHQHQHQHQHGHHGQHGQHRSSSRNGRDNWSKMPEPLNGHKVAEKSEKSSPSRRSLGGGSGSSSKQGSPSGRTKGVPPSFGYVKRVNGSGMTSTAEQQNIMMMGGGGAGGILPNGLPSGRTAHVSAVPRTAGGRKVSGGTQTLPNDMSKNPPNTQHRSFSLTGPSATQLSQSIRERLATGSHSLPKPGSDMHMFQHRISNRPGKMHDGSLSDTQTYAEVKPEYSSYAMWLKHSNTAGSRLSEGDSLENMQIGSPAMTRHGHKMLHSRTAAGGTAQGNESPYVQSPRLNRSNSIRSTKSEKMYPSMLSRGPDVEIEPYYCLPVGTLAAAAQNGTLSAQMAAAAAAAAAHVSGAGAMGVGVPGAGSAPIAWSQPTSPTPVNRGFNGPLSPTHGTTMVGAAAQAAATGTLTGAGGHRLTYPKKNDEVHGSAASLLSGGSSLYGSAEERQAHEIRRLKRELQDAREQVLSLSSQLSTNAHVVSAFEQSLSNMTNRLQHLTATAERKDGELTDMRQTIELLRKQSIQAGLTTAHMQSMGVQTQGQNQNELLSNCKSSKPSPLPPTMPGHQTQQGQHGNHSATTGNGSATTANGGAMQRHHSSDSMCSLNSISSGCSAQDKKQKKKGWLRSSFTKAFSRNAKISKTSRHVGHHHHHHHAHSQHGSGGVEHGLHGSPKANGHHQNYAHGHGEPVGLAALATQPAPPLPVTPSKGSPAKTVTLIENAKPIDAIESEEHQVVEELKKQLREKDLVLTDIRLEALSSASQLESLKETVNKMRAEMLSLKQNNERLQKLVTSRSLAGSEASLGNAISPNGSIGESRRYSLADGNVRPPMELPKRLEEEVEEENIPPAPAPEPPPPPPPLSPSTHIDLTPPPPALEPISSPAHISSVIEEIPDVTDGKKIAIACYLGQPESFAKYCEEMLEVDDFYANSAVIASHEGKDGGERKSYPATGGLNEFIIAYTYISGKTTWQNLDYIVRKTFKDYVSRIDPGTNLGLNTDSITSYHLGEAKRGPEMGFPELLPCGYIIGNVRTLYICLQGVGSLAFDSLIPRSIVHRYISLLTEHRRLILCGPSGTGKSYLARRLAEFLVARSGRGNPSEAIATFNVDHKSSKDLRQYLGHIAEQAAIANGASELPSVIILDNLHHASALGDVFSSLLSSGPAAKLPCIIGTMSQATCNTTNLQLHHNFRWVLTANHMEPVKGFLGRFLRRRLFQLELQTQHPQSELKTVLAWLPTVWQHINRFLEVHSSSDVTIGPRLFLSCPLDLKDSQVWFTDIWNYHLSPYLVEAVREGVQLYGRRGGAWNDPSAFIRNSYPWPYGPDSVPPLRQINAEDVGLEGVAANSGENQDPLLNMLMRLQEAANYSENQDQESDCASLDSNITPDSSAGAE